MTVNDLQRGDKFTISRQVRVWLETHKGWKNAIVPKGEEGEVVSVSDNGFSLKY